MHYYQHNIGDYRRDTSHLSLLEHGVYRQLLDMYYLSEERIPEETEVVYRRLSAKTNEEKLAVDVVLSEFFKRDSGWKHTRCDAEIAEYQGKADRARNNGKLGGRPPKTKVVISGNQEETQTKANSLTNKPINPITKETKTTPPSAPEGFDAFWAEWPASDRKGGKADCLKVWRKDHLEGVSIGIISHVKTMKTSREWQKEAGAYIPAPLVYLRGKRWDGAEIIPINGQDDRAEKFKGAI